MTLNDYGVSMDLTNAAMEAVEKKLSTFGYKLNGDDFDSIWDDISELFYHAQVWDEDD